MQTNLPRLIPASDINDRFDTLYEFLRKKP